jgi:hypothetical protein
MPYVWQASLIYVALKLAIWQGINNPLCQQAGDMSRQEEEEMTKTTFRMPKELLKDVQHFGIENDMTDTQIFNEALKAWMKEQRKLKKEYREIEQGRK